MQRALARHKRMPFAIEPRSERSEQRPFPPRGWSIAVALVVIVTLQTVIAILSDARDASDVSNIHDVLFEALLVTAVLGLPLSISIGARAFLLSALSFGAFVLYGLGCHRGGPRTVTDDLALWYLLMWLWLTVFSIGALVDAVERRRKRGVARARLPRL